MMTVLRTRVERVLSTTSLATLLLATTVATADGPAPGVRLAVPGRVNATPSIAALGATVAVVWGASVPGGATDVYSAVSQDGGHAFGAAVRVNDVPGAAKLGGEQPPHVALVARSGQSPAVVVVWTAAGTPGTELLTARSEDGGASFGRTAPIPGGQAAGNRGWESLSTTRDGQVIAVWLDHRETASSAASPMNHEGMNHTPSAAPKADSVARAQLSKLYFARVGAAGGGQAVTGGVCYCCKTGLAVGPDGAIYSAWRHVYPGNVRDIAFTVSRDGGRTFAAPIRVSDDRWVLDGCPENGPALEVDSRNRVHILWPTLVEGTARGDDATLALFYARSVDGRRFGARVRVPTEGVPRHPQIAIGAADAIVMVWDEGADGARRVVMGRWIGAGQRIARRVLTDGTPGVYPVVATTGNAAVVAWTSGTPERTVIQVRRLSGVGDESATPK